jgi:hypothetical protein
MPPFAGQLRSWNGSGLVTCGRAVVPAGVAMASESGSVR